MCLFMPDQGNEMPEIYQHTQIGRLNLVMLLGAAGVTFMVLNSAFDAASMLNPGLLRLAYLVSAAGFLLVFLGFSTLTIRVSGNALTIWFGWRGYRKVIPLEIIKTVTVVPNPRGYLWGIKSIPGGILYAIAPGSPVVELTLQDDRVIRLGSDDVECLQHTLQRAIASQQMSA